MASQGYVRYPTIFGDQIIFTAEDDLWRVSAQGGLAERLTAGVAEMTHASFSPDGTRLAFTNREEGPGEVYTMPVDGGPARRLTYLGTNAEVADWRPDGSGILFASNARQAMRRHTVLFEISPEGGEPVTLPYGIAHSIAFGPNGAVVLGRNTREPAHWKRYRGGTAGYLWIDPTGGGEFHRLLPFQSNIVRPCWVGGRIYFLSDHEGIGNVYSCLPSGEDLRRHTQHENYYARGLATDGQRLVYHAGGDLYLLPPDAAEGTRLDVKLTGSRIQRTRKFVSAARYLDSWAMQPQGASLAITSRGKAYSLGNWEGPVVQHGEPDGVRYRHLAYLADGQRLVAIGDTGEEPRLTLFAADGVTPPRIYDALDVGHVLDLQPSPLGEQVALVNHRSEILLVDLATGAMRVLDRSLHGRSETGGLMRGLAWSPDARWLAYTFGINPRQSAIKLCNVETGETYQATEPVLHDWAPAFDPTGTYLYFLSARDFDPVQDNLHFGWSFPKGVRPYLLTLRRETRSPFMPQPTAPGESERRAAEEHAKGDQQPAPPHVEIDLDGLSARVVAFPVAEGIYGRVQGTHDGVVFSSFPVEGTRKKDWTSLTPEANGSLEVYSFAQRKQDHLVDGISDFQVTPNGKTLLYRTGDRLRVLKAGEKPQVEQLPPDAREHPGRETGWIDLERVKVSVQPNAEWRQMFGEAWRLQREQFWVPDMAGVDWQRAYEKYAPLIERVGSRAELSDLFWELQGELGTSHAYEFGGEYREHPNYAQGYLGVNWRYDPDSGRYLIASIVRGDPWDAEATSPLLAPGVNAQVGESVLAINGQPVTRMHGPQELLVNTAGAEVQLLLQPADGSATPRSVSVRALENEQPARYRDWVAANRRRVHDATSGRVGYVHIPDMSSDGFAEFHRAYLAEYDHDGLIIDVRWNGGGIVSPLLLEILARPRLGYGFQRWGTPEPYFMESPRGPLVAVTDENAGSDGDIFSHAFKMLKLGPLVGKRTWGGVIGIEPYIPLADGTLTTQPEFSFWFKDVGWGVENYGTDPTIDVDYPPQAYAKGEDPQLQRAIAEALRLLEERPSATPEPGPYPFRGYPPRAE